MSMFIHGIKIKCLGYNLIVSLSFGYDDQSQKHFLYKMIYLSSFFQGLIFVVDSNDRERAEEARDELSKMVGTRPPDIQYNLCKTATLKKNESWVSTPIIAYCRSKVLQNAPRGAFCNTLDLHQAAICHQDLCFVYF